MVSMLFFRIITLCRIIFFILFTTFFVTAATFSIMHPNIILSNKIRMRIFNLKIVYINKRIKLFDFDMFNEKVITINTYKLIIYKKPASLNKSSILYIEWVIICSNDFFTVDYKMNKPVHLADICFKHSFFTCFERIRIS